MSRQETQGIKMKLTISTNTADKADAYVSEKEFSIIIKFLQGHGADLKEFSAEHSSVLDDETWFNERDRDEHGAR